MLKTDAEKYVRKIQESMVLTPKEELFIRSVCALALVEGQKQGLEYAKELNDEQNRSSNH